jgi:hypothetical protein
LICPSNSPARNQSRFRKFNNEGYQTDEQENSRRARLHHRGPAPSQGQHPTRVRNPATRMQTTAEGGTPTISG